MEADVTQTLHCESRPRNISPQESLTASVETVVIMLAVAGDVLYNLLAILPPSVGLVGMGGLLTGLWQLRQRSQSEI